VRAASRSTGSPFRLLPILERIWHAADIYGRDRSLNDRDAAAGALLRNPVSSIPAARTHFREGQGAG
jgi:hypothetical protein